MARRCSIPDPQLRTLARRYQKGESLTALAKGLPIGESALRQAVIRVSGGRLPPQIPKRPDVQGLELARKVLEGHRACMALVADQRVDRLLAEAIEAVAAAEREERGRASR